MKKTFSSLFESIIRFFRRQFRNPRKRILIEVAAVAVIIGIVIFMVFSDRKSPTADLKKGVSYIQSLEKKDTDSIEKEIKEIKKAERKAALENGEIDVWQQFDDAAIFGDSRAVGFKFYEFISEDRVFANSGDTIKAIPKQLEQLKVLNPSFIFICFGINDMGSFNTVDDYIKELDDIQDQIHENLPDTRIFINSIIPVIDPAFKKFAKWKDIPDWNAAIEEHCEKNNIPYIDITDTVEEHSDLYENDGIHMRKPFYNLWAIDMMTEVNENE